MALQSDAIHESLNDFIALLPEVKQIISDRGANIGQDIITVEHLGEAVVMAASRIGIPYAATLAGALPIAHQIAGVFASWMQGKNTIAANATLAPATATGNN